MRKSPHFKCILTVSIALVPEIKLSVYFEKVKVKIANEDGFRIVVQVHAKMNDNEFPNEYPFFKILLRISNLVGHH